MFLKLAEKWTGLYPEEVQQLVLPVRDNARSSFESVLDDASDDSPDIAIPKLLDLLNDASPEEAEEIHHMLRVFGYGRKTADMKDWAEQARIDAEEDEDDDFITWNRELVWSSSKTAAIRGSTISRILNRIKQDEGINLRGKVNFSDTPLPDFNKFVCDGNINVFWNPVGTDGSFEPDGYPFHTHTETALTEKIDYSRVLFGYYNSDNDQIMGTPPKCVHAFTETQELTEDVINLASQLFADAQGCWIDNGVIWDNRVKPSEMEQPFEPGTIVEITTPGQWESTSWDAGTVGEYVQIRPDGENAWIDLPESIVQVPLSDLRLPSDEQEQPTLFSSLEAVSDDSRVSERKIAECVDNVVFGVVKTATIGDTVISSRPISYHDPGTEFKIIKEYPDGFYDVIAISSPNRFFDASLEEPFKVKGEQLGLVDHTNIEENEEDLELSSNFIPNTENKFIFVDGETIFWDSYSNIDHADVIKEIGVDDNNEVLMGTFFDVTQHLEATDQSDLEYPSDKQVQILKSEFPLAKTLEWIGNEDIIKLAYNYPKWASAQPVATVVRVDHRPWGGKNVNGVGLLIDSGFDPVIGDEVAVVDLYGEKVYVPFESIRSCPIYDSFPGGEYDEVSFILSDDSYVWASTFDMNVLHPSHDEVGTTVLKTPQYGFYNFTHGVLRKDGHLKIFSPEDMSPGSVQRILEILSGANISQVSWNGEVVPFDTTVTEAKIAACIDNVVFGVVQDKQSKLGISLDRDPETNRFRNKDLWEVEEEEQNYGEHYRDWAYGLSDEEKASWAKYISSIQPNFYLSQNRMWGEDPEQEQIVQNMDSSISKGQIPEDTVVYRGTGSKDILQAFDQGTLVGTEFTMPTFASSSLYFDIALDFSSGHSDDDTNGIVFDIFLPEGQAAVFAPSLPNMEAEERGYGETGGDIDPFYHQLEVTLPRDLTYRVTDAWYDDNNEVRRASVEIVNPSTSFEGEDLEKTAATINEDGTVGFEGSDIGNNHKFILTPEGEFYAWGKKNFDYGKGMLAIENEGTLYDELDDFTKYEWNRDSSDTYEFYRQQGYATGQTSSGSFFMLNAPSGLNEAQIEAIENLFREQGYKNIIIHESGTKNHFNRGKDALDWLSPRRNEEREEFDPEGFFENTPEEDLISGNRMKEANWFVFNDEPIFLNEVPEGNDLPSGEGKFIVFEYGNGLRSMFWDFGDDATSSHGHLMERFNKLHNPIGVGYWSPSELEVEYIEDSPYLSSDNEEPSEVVWKFVQQYFPNYKTLQYNKSKYYDIGNNNDR